MNTFNKKKSFAIDSETLGIISIFLFLLPSIVFLFLGIFYQAMARFGLFRFLAGVVIAIFALATRNK